MKKIFLIFAISISLITLSACSSDDKKDLKGAVPVFTATAALKADESLQDQKIVIPAQKENSSWFGSANSSLEEPIENFAFTSKITKSKNIWAGFRSSSSDKKLFRPLIVDGVIYLLDTKGNLIARNLSNYKKIWQKTIFTKKDKKDFLNGKIFFNNGKIFATSGFNYLSAINAKNGEIIWSKKMGSIPISTPVANTNQLFVITADNQTYALNANTGQINWIHSGVNKNTAILGSADPVFYKNYLISAYSSGEIYILDQKNGEASWSQDLNLNKAVDSDFILNDIDATPIVKNGVIYTIGNGGLMMSIKAETGNVLWQKELSSISDFWVASDYIYLINNDNVLICLERFSGKIKWFNELQKIKDPADKAIFFGIIMAGNNLVLSNSHNEVLLVSVTNGEILQKKKIGREINHTPIVVNKKLYLNSLGRFIVNLTVME